MDIQNKIERFLLGQMSESERTDFEIEMHENPLLKDQVELEQAIVTQIRSRAFVDEQIKQAKEELKQEKFEDYLLGRMTESEKAKFEKELENNPMLKEQLELERAIVGQISNRAFVEEQINTAKKEMKRGKTVRLVLYSITSIAAIFIFSLFITSLFTNPNFDELYASNFTSYTNDYMATDGAYRGDVKIDSLLLTAMKSYEKQDYVDAETQFNQILSSKDNPNIRFYLAVSQLETGKTELAISTLNTLLSQPNEKNVFDYYEQTRWYLALVNLKLHQKSDAKKYLKELVALEGVYWDKAKELLKALE